MKARTLTVMFLLLFLSFGRAIDTVKSSAAFSGEDLPIVLKNLEEFCTHLEKSKIHSVYVVPKLQGSFVRGDTPSMAPDPKILTGQCGYFLQNEAAKFVEGLKKPSAVTMYDIPTTHLIIPLTAENATAEELVTSCFWDGSDRFIFRKRIAQFENGRADFVYEGEFAIWVKKHMLNATPQ